MIALPLAPQTRTTDVACVPEPCEEPTRTLQPSPTAELSDDRLIGLWLAGRSPHTIRAYLADIQRFRQEKPKPLRSITLTDLHDFALGFSGTPVRRRRMLAAIKSLFAFGFQLGYLPFDVGRVLRVPGLRETLNARILSETQVHKMLAVETTPRNALLLKLLYASGARISEICTLRWGDCIPRERAGQITLFGKGAKTRTVLLSEGMWEDLMRIRGGMDDDAPVFIGRGGTALGPSMAWRIIRSIARAAGLRLKVSPHWLRHAHGSHALDRGAPIHLVQQTLGHASVATTGKYLHARPNDSSGKYLSI